MLAPEIHDFCCVDMGAIAFVTGIFHESPTNRSKLPLLNTGGYARTTSGPNECLGLVNGSGIGSIVASFSKFNVLAGGLQGGEPSRERASHGAVLPRHDSEVQLAEVGV